MIRRVPPLIPSLLGFGVNIVDVLVQGRDSCIQVAYNMVLTFIVISVILIVIESLKTDFELLR